MKKKKKWDDLDGMGVSWALDPSIPIELDEARAGNPGASLYQTFKLSGTPAPKLIQRIRDTPP
jgi:hypothetical protein